MNDMFLAFFSLLVAIRCSVVCSCSRGRGRGRRRRRHRSFDEPYYERK